MIQKQLITDLYTRWGPIYNLAHHLQTMWTDSKYRRLVAHYGSIKPTDVVLDVCTGTGLTGLEALHEQPNAFVVGIDLTYKMLQNANLKLENIDHIALIQGDVENLPIANNSIDVVLSTYGLGGINDKDKALDEIVRVSKNNGRIVAVEMTMPPSRMHMKRIIHRHLTEPVIRRLWGFRDTDLLDLFSRHQIEIEGTRYLDEFVFGSSRLIYGFIRK